MVVDLSSLLHAIDRTASALSPIALITVVLAAGSFALIALDDVAAVLRPTRGTGHP
jgi:hypothetical protein